MSKSVRFTNELKQDAMQWTRVLRVQTPCNEKRALDQLFEICNQCPLSRHGLYRRKNPAVRANRCCASEERKSKVCFVRRAAIHGDLGGLICMLVRRTAAKSPDPPMPHNAWMSAMLGMPKTFQNYLGFEWVFWQLKLG
jgi:hypothetical protein